MRYFAVITAFAGLLVAARPSFAWPPMPGVVYGDVSVHDPTMIKKGSTYYLFTTHDCIGIRKSMDRTNWWYAGQAVPWWGSQDVWAPDVTNHGSEYWLLYAHTEQFGSQRSSIYLATSETLEPGSYTDKGIIFTSKDGDPYNAIDPAAIKDASGNWWIVFGSWYQGIYIFPVDNNGKQTGSPVRIAHRSNSAAEGPSIYFHNNKYYLFASWGNCCPSSRGVVGALHEPYHIVVCRSNTINGNYVDAGGVSCLHDGHLEILHGQGNVWGTGGQMVFHDSTDVLVYHWYNSSNSYLPSLGINLFTWDKNDWPIAY